MFILSSINIDIICILLLLALLIIARKDFKAGLKDDVNRNYIFIIFFIITILFLQILIIIVQSSGDTALIPLNRFLNSLVFALSPFIAIISFYSLENWLHIDFHIKYLHYLSIINAILCLFNLKFDIFFLVNYNNRIEKGTLFYLPLFLSLFYLLYCVLILFKNKNIINRSYSLLLAFHITTIFAAFIIQIFLNDITIIWNFISILMVFSYIKYQQHLIIYDTLTLCKNRYQFDKKLFRLNQKKQPFTLILFDLNNFKMINELFGYTEGNEVLINSAKLITQAFKPSIDVFRFNGDKFIILLFNNNRNKVSKYLSNLLILFNKYNKYSTKPYSLAYKYKVHEFHNNCSLNECISKIDKILYSKDKEDYKNI